MRIISGTYRGKVILAPKDLPVRPTTDFAKTGLFNILNNHFNFLAISVLDLFSGTGNISYEFISRGCKDLVAVDTNGQCTKFIQQTFDRLEVHGFIGVNKSDATQFLMNTEHTFDIIFADPPYELNVGEQLHKIIFERNLLNKKGMFVYEHLAGKNYSPLPFFTEKRKYGNVAFSFFKNEV